MDIVKKILITFLFATSWSLAQEELAKSEDEKVRIYVSPDEQLVNPEILKFKGEQASLIEWDRLEESKFLDLDQWRVDIRVKQKEPRWRRNLQERRLREKMGYILECVGECRLYRGLGYANVGYLSTIREGDELQTKDDSYVWVYLLDGTMVRLSPQGSITFKEFNIGLKENFLYLRLNAGNSLVWSRRTNELEAQSIKETDSLFFPLSLGEANPPRREKKLDEEDLFKFLEDSNDTFVKYEKLNKLIKRNNVFISKKTEYFLVMPNGTIQGSSIVGEFVVLTGNKSFFKLRDKEQVGLKGEFTNPDITFYFRGFSNEDKVQLDHGKWYEVDAKGRELKNREAGVLAMGEFVTKNIPSIFIARELLFSKYSLFTQEVLNDKELAEEYGYRLWQSRKSKNSDLEQRLNFLIEYTRRVETTNLLVAEQFKKKLERSGEKWESSEYTQDFYRKAMGDFYNYREGASIFSGVKESLNSERKPFWRKVNSKK